MVNDLHRELEKRMKLAQFRTGAAGAQRLGVLVGGMLVDVAALARTVS